MNLALLLATAISAAPFPSNLVEVCIYSDKGPDICVHRFQISSITDCGNPDPLTTYQSGNGLLILHISPWQNLVYRYTDRYYGPAESGAGDRLSIIAWDKAAFGDGMESCETYVY